MQCCHLRILFVEVGIQRLLLLVRYVSFSLTVLEWCFIFHLAYLESREQHILFLKLKGNEITIGKLKVYGVPAYYKCSNLLVMLTQI